MWLDFSFSPKRRARKHLRDKLHKAKTLIWKEGDKHCHVEASKLTAAHIIKLSGPVF